MFLFSRLVCECSTPSFDFGGHVGSKNCVKLCVCRSGSRVPELKWNSFWMDTSEIICSKLNIHIEIKKHDLSNNCPRWKLLLGRSYPVLLLFALVSSKQTCYHIWLKSICVRNSRNPARNRLFLLSGSLLWLVPFPPAVAAAVFCCCWNWKVFSGCWYNSRPCGLKARVKIISRDYSIHPGQCGPKAAAARAINRRLPQLVFQFRHMLPPWREHRRIFGFCFPAKIAI